MEPPEIVGVSKNIRRVKELIDHIADIGLNTVITGETGVGKELVAQVLFSKSPRKTKPFIKVNCAALPEGLLESELFGYERGAFTGAERRKKGKFELAHGGVIFLDEIGDMSLPLQSKLLHVLQSGEFAPLGSERIVTTDSWVIAATNHNLEEAIEQERFREDLYYRLNIVNIHVAPLRERPDDIPHLIDFFSQRYIAEYGSRNFVTPDDELMTALVAYSWPGNVRELQNVIKKVLVLGDWEEVIAALNGRTGAPRNTGAPMIRPAEVRTGDGGGQIYMDGFSVPADDLSRLSLKRIRKKAVDRVEKKVISHVLEKMGWNRSKAATILKISYKTLLYKIKELEITAEEDIHK